MRKLARPRDDGFSAKDASLARPRHWRANLFSKYVLSFVGLVTVVLLANSLVDATIRYRDTKAVAVRLQAEKAEAAAQRIDLFVAEIERQVGWTTHAQWALGSVEQRRFDFVRLLRQVPAITELIQIDGAGREVLRVSRIAMDVVDAGTDFSKDPRFIEPSPRQIWFSEVYFRKESEPYLTMSMARSGRNSGVTVAEVNLKLIWDVITSIKAGRDGYAFVVDRRGRLVAHPDISLVLQNTDLSSLPQVKAALADPDGHDRSDPAAPAQDVNGRDVLTAYAPIARLGWLVFVEIPLREAFAPIVAGLYQTAWLFLAALVFSTIAAWFLARRMTGPIRALEAGAARIGTGDLGHRITIRTDDELERLADRFNQTAAQLAESYGSLEAKVEERTLQLSESLAHNARLVDELKAQTAALETSVAELRTLGEVGQSVTATLDIDHVLDTVVAGALKLACAKACLIFRYQGPGRFLLWRSNGLSEAQASELRALVIEANQTLMGVAVERREPTQVEDLTLQPSAPLRDASVRAGFRAALILPLVRADRIFGTLVVLRDSPGAFPSRTIDTLQTFAAQSVLSIQNARLFADIETKGRELAEASRHKSQFLANMSHELRTPMNAVLGFTEMMADGLYGPLPDKAVRALDRVQANGKHLLGLINDVLDFSKIEAGQLVVAHEPYAWAQIVQTVLATLEPLARAKGLTLGAAVDQGLPTGYGDERRLTQVLLNLAGNAIKFTDTGEIVINAGQDREYFEIAVTDTGPGIALQDQERIFDQFQQVDDSSTRRKGGAGLGLAISRSIVALHGGTLGVESELGRGSTFRIRIPVLTTTAKEAAE